MMKLDFDQTPAMLNLVSLFAGVGGFDLAAQQVGITPAVACEIDPHARGVLRHRFPEATIINDVKEVSGDKLRSLGLDPATTIISGGFPCQDLSVAGKQAGLTGGERSSLFFEIVRLLQEFNPKWFVLENVPGLLSSKSGRDMGIVIGALAELGYGISWRVLDAQHFGVPQRRRRVFIVGHLGADASESREVLFEREGSIGDYPQGDTQGQGATSATDGRTLARMRGFGDYELDGTASALKARDYKDATDLVLPSPTVAFGLDDNLNGARELMGPLNARAESGSPARSVAVVPFVKSKRAQNDEDHETWLENGVAPTLNSINNSGESCATVLMIDGTRVGDVRVYDDEISQTVISRWGTGGGNVPYVFGFSHTQGLDPQASDTVFPTLRANGSGQAVSTSSVVRTTTADVCGPLTALGMANAKGTETVESHHYALVGDSMVRRLTPRECERLQGFPDDWTAQRWDEKKQAVVDQADSSRYKQMGNAVAVPVVAWILDRIREMCSSLDGEA